MPTSESFTFSEEDPMPDMFPFDLNHGVDFDGASENSPPMKDVSFVDLSAFDGAALAMYDGSTYAFPQQSNQAITTIDNPNSKLPSHRGSTSSSSSLRSMASSSPHTSIDATPMDTSSSQWLDEIRGSDDTFNVDQYLILSSDSSSSTPPGASEPSPEFRTTSETLPQGRAVKRRKGQPKNRTGQSSGSAKKKESKCPSEFSPTSAQLHSSESSPTPVYIDNLASPDSNLPNYGNAFATNWPPATNGQPGNSLFTFPRSDPAYIPLADHDIPNASPPTSLSHSSVPRLFIHPMPAKSRVETQIPLKITMHNLPKGIKRVHLPTHTIAKPKLLQKPSAGPCPDMLELTTMLVCTSAMTDETRLKRAFSRAAGKPQIKDLHSTANGFEDEENKPQNGGEVRICTGCITRERKRAGRKKHKKPEEEELWDRYEQERAIVFNTLEVKEWQTVTPVMADPTGAGLINGAIPEGTVQVDAPMRIACYCRHHGEKLGFQVIITLKDHVGNIVAQGISSSIMITDDHKTPTHTGPAPTPQPSSQPQLQQSPQPPVNHGPHMSLHAGIPQPITTHPAPIQPRGAPPLSFQHNSGDISSLPFRQNHSTSDLQSQGQNLPATNSPSPHANCIQPTQGAVTPHNLSRQTSPASPLSATTRKRKASMNGKVPAGLAMTKIETGQSPLPMASNVQNDTGVMSAGNSPFSATMTYGPLNGELSNQGRQHMLNNVSQVLGGAPATPSNNGTEPFMFTGINHRAMNLERPINQLFSAPVSAHPSRAPSPSQLRPDPQNIQHTQRPQDMLSGPLPPLPTIHKIIPNEGSKCGGAEITVLGSNFTNHGLEVYFGSQRAITTTYWGPQSLVCMLPPSPVAGPVQVRIKQPGRPQAVKQPPFFNYKDDDEDQLIRIALGLLAGHYGAITSDPVGFAKRVLFDQTSTSGSGNQAPHGTGNNGFTHLSLEPGEAVESSLLRILEMMDLNESPHPVRINHRRPTGQTMLHLAASLGFVQLVAGLLVRGANVHIKDKGGFTPLHMAAMNNRPEIVRRLIAKGADRNVRSHSGLTPIDVAGSVSVRRSLQYVEIHYRSRSIDSRRSRASSRSSIRSLWEPSAMTPVSRQDFLSGNFDMVTAANVDDSSEEASNEEDAEWLNSRGRSLSGLRRRSTVEPHPVNEADEGPASPGATMAAIREQVAAQLQQFQHTMAMHLQNLPQLQMPNIPQIPNLPPMPVLPDYQAYLQSAPVMQRISSLVPNIRGQRQEPTGDHPSNSNDSKWGVFPFFGNKESPPAYEEIFPQKDLDIKQSSAARAAAEFEADAKCAALFDQDKAESSHSQEVPTVLQIGRKHLITKEQQETLQRAHAQRLKAGSSDKMLWFVWIPILVFVLGAMLWNGAPSLVSGTTNVAKTLGGLAANPRSISDRIRNMVQELA
ncbi:hypothetical protein F5Y07DRAFT_63460 [Xylaria sp. FL0933]|nr:hypothetical protein F5Y07DRAFT_63460 [Xylaria sp. FL0933]